MADTQIDIADSRIGEGGSTPERSGPGAAIFGKVVALGVGPGRLRSQMSCTDGEQATDHKSGKRDSATTLGAGFGRSRDRASRRCRMAFGEGDLRQGEESRVGLGRHMPVGRRRARAAALRGQQRRSHRRGSEFLGQER